MHEQEVKRDIEARLDRVVETWHVGNLAWSLMRLKVKVLQSELSSSSEELKRQELIDKARAAIQDHQKTSIVLLVHLKMSPESSLRRRRSLENNQARIPMEDETTECNELHDALDVVGEELAVLEFQKSGTSFPVLVVDNSEDGPAAMDKTVCSIVSFVNAHRWRTYLP